MADPTLRAATRADDAGMRAVIAASFPDNPKQRAEITAWQYWGNPFGPTAAWVWEDEGRIVATYTSYPMPAVLEGRPAIAGNGVDAAVDPAYQGRRLFEPLARALYAGAADAGMAVTMCFINNPLAIRGTTKAGWLDVGRLTVWVLAVDDAWLGRRVHLPAAVAGIGRRAVWRLGRGSSAEIVDGVPAGLDALWSSSGGVTTGVVRDQAWWDWRYGGHPDRPYRFLEVRRGSGGSVRSLAGAAVAITREAFGGRFVYLLELLAADDDVGAALGRAAAAHARAEGAAGVALMGLARSRVAQRAVEAGFRRLPARMDPKPTSFGAVPNDGHTWAHLATLPWSVSWGDLDHL
jgi:predicted N-acetyltransferase YhbS